MTSPHLPYANNAFLQHEGIPNSGLVTKEDKLCRQYNSPTVEGTVTGYSETSRTDLTRTDQSNPQVTLSLIHI